MLQWYVLFKMGLVWNHSRLLWDKDDDETNKKTFPKTFSYYYEETIGSSHKETIISTFEEALEKTNETPDNEIIITTFEEALEKTLGSSYEENNLAPY